MTIFFIWELVTLRLAGDWRRLHNKELRSFYAPPNIRVIKLRRMRYAGRVALMGDTKIAYKFFYGKTWRGETKRKIILEWILGKYDVKVWSGFICVRIESVAGCCEHGNEPSVSVKRWGIFWQAEWPLASQDLLYSSELVS